MSTRRWKLVIFVAQIILLLGICRSTRYKQDLHYSFMHEATSAPDVSFYDYIVVGGGTAGCPLGATLSERATVLILERGAAPYGNRNVENIAGFFTNLANRFPDSPAQSFISEDGVMNARPNVLGGGSAINAGFYTRASREYVNGVGWAKETVEESFQWVEKKVVFKPPVLQWQSAVLKGLLEVGILPNNGFTFEHIQGTKVGGTIFDETGHRHSAADLLEYAVPNRTTVYLHAYVHKILFDTNGSKKPRAHAVLFEDGNGKMHTAYLNKDSSSEILLTAGAIGSPQILMLTGIGPKAHLQNHGIQVVLDQPLVGQEMSDNPMNGLFIPSPRPVELSLIQVVGITPFGSFIQTASVSGFPNQQGWSAVMPHMVVGMVNRTLNGGMILEKIDGPLSTGYLQLRTTDPKDNPSVTFNYFKNPEDLQKCVKGMQTIIDVINSEAFSSFRYFGMPVRSLMATVVGMPVNVRPRRPSAAFSLEHFCEDTVMTIWHYHGGCQVGKVVDRDYKVMGVDSLRVIDGSTFIRSPGTNPQATVMMLGRYMGVNILRERLHQRA